jgi:hypothetical protein
VTGGYQQTDKQWRGFQRGRNGIPSLNVIKKHGGLRTLVREAAHPDWLERAQQWDANGHSTPPRPQGRPKSDKRDQVVATIRTGRPSSEERFAGTDFPAHGPA